MSLIFSQLLDGALHEQAPFEQIWFAQDQGVPPGFSYQVNARQLTELISQNDNLTGKAGQDIQGAGLRLLDGDYGLSCLLRHGLFFPWLWGGGGTLEESIDWLPD